MKAILEFNLPDESQEWLIHKQAEQNYLRIDEAREAIRSIRKYCEISEEVYDKLTEVLITLRDEDE